MQLIKAFSLVVSDFQILYSVMFSGWSTHLCQKCFNDYINKTSEATMTLQGLMDGDSSVCANP